VRAVVIKKIVYELEEKQEKETAEIGQTTYQVMKVS
jgi:hypothetical protein